MSVDEPVHLSAFKETWKDIYTLLPYSEEKSGLMFELMERAREWSQYDRRTMEH